MRLFLNAPEKILWLTSLSHNEKKNMNRLANDVNPPAFVPYSEEMAKTRVITEVAPVDEQGQSDAEFWEAVDKDAEELNRYEMEQNGYYDEWGQWVDNSKQRRAGAPGTSPVGKNKASSSSSSSPHKHYGHSSKSIASSATWW